MNPNPLDSSTFFSRQHTQIQIKDNPLSFYGRFGRLSYIAWNGFFNLIFFFSIITISLVIGIFNFSTQSLDSNFINALTGFGGFGFLIVFILYTYFNIVITARRFHDMNLSAWWMLLFFIPIVNFVLFFFLILVSGTHGSNRFGAQRSSAVWEKILAWFMIILSVLSIFATGSLISYLMGSGQIDTPTEIIQQSSDYF